jgi:membrane protease YdiL (CAAX protease family)
MGETPETDPWLEVRPAPLPEPTAVEFKLPPPERNSRELWLETVVVLCVAILPSIFSAFYPLIWPAAQHARSSIEDSVELIELAFVPCVLVLYLIHRGGEPMRQFGLQRPYWLGDILGAAGLWLAYSVLWRMLSLRFWPMFEAVEHLIPAEADHNTLPVPYTFIEHLLVLLSCGAIGFSEELVTRGYLLPRFERLLGSAWKSVVLTAFLFALWHVYQGTYGFIHAGFLGLCFGAVFCLIRRVWPLVLCHALLNWIATTRVLSSLH